MEKQPIKTVGIVAKRNIVSRPELIHELVKYLKSRKKEIIFDENAALVYPKAKGLNKSTLLNRADLAIILGGDGTILKTARRLSRKKVLILGVNTGTLGFLSECKPKQLASYLDKIFDGQYFVDRRALLRATVYRNGKKIETFLALNDAVINQGAFARLIEIKLEVDGRKVVTVKADGLIIATPTGSTAHSLSAGGPIVHPLIQGITLTPICPATLSMRSIIIPDNRQMTALIATKREEESAIIGLTIDGQDMMVLHYGDKVKVRRSSRNIYFIRTQRRYYRILRKKLHWGES